MKKYEILVLAIAFMFSSAVSAQDQQPKPEKDGHKKEFKHSERPQLSAQKRAGYLAVDLELTDAQRAKVQALFEKQDKVREERQAEVKKLKEQEMAKFEAERKANDAEMEKILGADKFQQLKAKQAERMENMKDRMQERRFKGPKGHAFPADRGPRAEKQPE